MMEKDQRDDRWQSAMPIIKKTGKREEKTERRVVREKIKETGEREESEEQDGWRRTWKQRRDTRVRRENSEEPEQKLSRKRENRSTTNYLPVWNASSFNTQDNWDQTFLVSYYFKNKWRQEYKNPRLARFGIDRFKQMSPLFMLVPTM